MGGLVHRWRPCRRLCIFEAEVAIQQRSLREVLSGIWRAEGSVSFLFQVSRHSVSVAAKPLRLPLRWKSSAGVDLVRRHRLQHRAGEISWIEVV